MRERVELLGGSLHAEPNGRGWRLLALLPAGGREGRDWQADAAAVLQPASGGPARIEVAEQPG